MLDLDKKILGVSFVTCKGTVIEYCVLGPRVPLLHKDTELLIFSVFVSLDESWEYLGFSVVRPPPQRFPFRRDNFKNILVRPFKFGMWVYMGNAVNTFVL